MGGIGVNKIFEEDLGKFQGRSSVKNAIKRDDKLENTGIRQAYNMYKKKK